MKQQKKNIIRGLKLLVAIASVFIIAIATQEIGQRKTSNPIGTEPQQAQVERLSEAPEGYTGIYDVDGLKAMADDLAGKYILMADIDMQGIEWTPIGTSLSSAFTGIFDGNLYTINNLRIDKNLTSIGFFGYTTNANIKNLVIEDITVIGYSNAQYIGGLIGYQNDGGVENVKVTGNITRTGSTTYAVNVGGMIGYSVRGTVTKSYSMGNTMNENARGGISGGLIGYAHWTTISKCYSTMNITSTSDTGNIFSGGLVGFLEAGYINNSYSTGSVIATSTSGTIDAGSLLGYNNSKSLADTILHTYAVGKVEMNTNGEKNCNGIVGITTAATTQSFWTPETVGEEYNGTIKKLFASMLHKDTFKSTVSKWNWDFDTIWQIEEGETMPYLRDMEKPKEVNKDCYTYVRYEGKGTKEEPFLIKTQEELQAVRNQIKSTYYKLANDIIADNTKPFDPIPFDDLNAYFDGDNHKIIGLTIESDKKYVGIFSKNEGIIKNLIIENIRVTSTNTSDIVRIGGVVGDNSGTIENVTISGEVKRINNESGDTYIGGVVGENSGKIINACNTANVTSQSNGIKISGGIAGQNRRTISKSYNKGTIETSQGIIISGGLVGRNYQYQGSEAYIRESYNKGSITARTGKSDSYVGGLVGKNEGDKLYSEISNCYCIGDVEAEYPITSGGLVGYNLKGTITNTYAAGKVLGTRGLVAQNENGTVTNSYWSPETTGKEDSQGGTSKTIKEMLYQDAYENWDFDTIWKIEPNGGSLAYLRELERAEGILRDDLIVKAEHTIIRKYKTNTETPLQGATIGLFDAEGNKIAEQITNERGQVDFTNLEVGTYQYQELEAPTGYVRNENMYELTVENNGSVTYGENNGIIYNDPVRNNISVTIHQTGTRRPIPGAIIGIYDKENNPVMGSTGTPITAITNNNGEATIPDIEFGDYIYKVESVPEGYVKPEGEYKVTIDTEGNVEHENGTGIIESETVKAEHTIIRKYKTNTETPLQGATIGLFDAEGNKIAEQITNERGQVDFTNLEVGTYQYQELEAPVGYVRNETVYEVTIGTDGSVNFVTNNGIIYNDRVTTPEEFIVTKYRVDTTMPLSGAVIGLFDESGNKLQEQTTGENGQVNFGKLEVGSYYYQELNAPVAYVLNDTKYYFTVENNGNVTFLADANGIIYNEPIKVDVTINKYKTGTTNPVSGATIAVFDVKGNKLEEKVTDTNGQVVFNLEVGSYHYKELEAPEGYLLNSTMYSFTIANDGSIKFASNTNGIIYNKPVQTGVIITKYRTGTETPLAGAVIGLFDTDGNKLQEGTTTENGQVLFENVEVGTYQYQELEAPLGYVRNETVYEVTIGTDGSVNFVTNNGIIYNDRVTMKESFTITKYRTNTTTPLAGAVIGIIDAAGNKLTQATTDENGTITVSGLEVGNYYYQELEAPLGYVRNETMYGFVVENDGTVTFVQGANKIIYNNRVTMKESFTITKYRTGTENLLSGATIGIFDAAGNKLTQATTDENGTITVSGLEVGNYYYQELQSPEGYVLNATKYNFTVNNDGIVTFVENANKIIYNDRVTTPEGFIVTKYRTNTTIPLSGATIGLFNESGNKLQEQTTGENGQVNFGKLEVGSYYYQELNAPEGYVLNNNQYHFTVENNGSITYVQGANGIIYNEPVRTNVVITKYRAGTTTPLAGAVIGLFDNEGNPMLANGEQIKGTTTAEGTLTIVNLEPGTYRYQELEAPTGYILNDTMYQFTIGNDGTVTFENNTRGIIYNEPIRANVTITKYREETTIPLAGATIAIFDARENKIDEKTTESNGQITFNNLEVGNYYYQEQTAPQGYIRNNTKYHFTITNNGTVIFENDTNGIIYNTPVRSNVIIMKYRAGTETPLLGASIALFDINGNKLDENVTGSNGIVLFNNLEVGTYQYQELVAPAGYLLNNTMYQFTINNDGSITYGENNGIIYNEPVRTNVVITKYRAGTTTPLAGAVIGLFDADGHPMLTNGEQIKGTTTSEGTLTIVNLEPGTYHYQELEAPLGYVRNETMYCFTIANDGTVTFENDTKGIIYNEPVRADVTITKYKTGTTTPVAGATIALFDKTGNKVEQKITNSNGQVTFTNLEVGHYRYQEQTAPAGYILNSTVYEFSVNVDGSIDYGENNGNLYNDPVKADVTIIKYRIESTTPLAGATIGLFNESGNKLQEKTTGENGQITFTGLEVGTYQYQETQAPIGYVLNNDIYTFTVNVDGTITYGDNNGVIYNEPIKSSAVITKYITGTKEPVEGALIGLFNKEGNKLQEKTTTDNGTVLFENLEIGEYRYQELEAPAGYILNGSIYEFTINTDGSVTYGDNNAIIYNDTIKANIIITKRISGTQNTLAGAVIGLFDENGNKLEEKVTSDDGTVLFGNLEVGTYQYQELEAPLGYVLNDKTYIVTVNLDGSVTYGDNNGIIYNDLIQTDVTITKYITGTTIQVKGATIGLFDENGNKLDEKVTDTEGKVIFGGLTKGTYRYQELQAPAGYILNNTSYTFTVNTDGSITYGDNNGIIYNDVITANVTITKYETGTNIKLQGATIGLFDTAGNKLLEAITTEEGTITFRGLTKGNYYYQELQAPDGYILNDTKYTLTVDENGTVTYAQNNGNLYNDKIVIEEIKGNVTILKLENKTNRQLEGAVIGLFNAEGNKLDEKITNTNGEVTFAGLKVGQYYYQELQAPAGYQLNNTKYQVTVNEDGSISYAENKGILYNEKIEKPEEPKDPEQPEKPIEPEEPQKPEPPKDKPIIDNLPSFLPQTGEQIAIIIFITMAMSSATYYGIKLYKQKRP